MCKSLTPADKWNNSDYFVTMADRNDTAIAELNFSARDDAGWAAICVGLRGVRRRRGPRRLYVRWFVEHAFVLVPAQAIVGQHLMSFKEFPPRQEPGSFSVEQAMEKLRNPRRATSCSQVQK